MHEGRGGPLRLSIGHNFAADLGARILSTLASLALSITLVRYLGPSDYGRYAFGMSLGAVLVVMIELGLNDLITRDVARDPSMTRDYMVRLFRIRLATSIPVLGLVPLIAYLMGKDTDSIRVAALSCAYLVLFHQCTLFWSVWTGMQRLWLASLAQWLDRVGALAIVLAIAALGLGLKTLLWGFILLAALMLAATVSGSFIALKSSSLPRRGAGPSFFAGLVREGWPLAALAIISILVIHGERIIVSGFRGDQELGFYSAAASMIQFPLFIPVALVNAFFPRLSGLIHPDRGKAQGEYEKVMGLLFLFGIGVAVGGAILSRELLSLMYGHAYDRSSSVFAILCFGLPLAVPGKLIALLALSLGKQRTQLLIYGTTIPIYLAVQGWAAAATSIEGVAIVRIFFDSLWVGLMYKLVSRPFHRTMSLRAIGQGLAAAGVMAVILFLFRGLHVLIAIPVGAAVYLSSLVALGALGPDDWRLLRSAIAVKPRAGKGETERREPLLAPRDRRR